MTETSQARFEHFALPQPILQAISEIGFETPSPIQEKTIPLLLEGNDVLGLAQTGTGKTAAFSLPLVAQVDPSNSDTQLLVLAPTRELANQVCEAIQSFIKYINGVNVLALYGGSDYGQQLRALRRGAQIVVGTPGRIIDHLERGTLKLAQLKALVLDEADEMLRMGFIDDVERIMRDTPSNRQTALFSATMPPAIRKLTSNYMNSPVEVKIAAKTQTVSNIEQFFWRVAGVNKFEALARILELQGEGASIIFSRTKSATAEVAERLEARGFRAAALNGDMSQQLRERTIERLKGGQLDVVVATDVAARGLDVERINLVVNFDIPFDAEAYVHRIGRTGRAGRSGKAIMFVGGREMRLLRNIERTTRHNIEEMMLPGREEIEQHRINRFESDLGQMREQFDAQQEYQEIAANMAKNLGLSELELATLLLAKAQQSRPFKLPPDPKVRDRRERRERDENGRGPRDENARGPKRERGDRSERGERGDNKERRKRKTANVAMETYRIDAGRVHGVHIKHIVGAIANEADISSEFIGHIKLHDEFSTVELPVGMPEGVFKHLRRSFVGKRPMRIEVYKP